MDEGCHDVLFLMNFAPGTSHTDSITHVHARNVTQASGGLS